MFCTGFLTESGKKRASVILSTEDQSNFQVTQMKVKVSVCVVFIYCSSALVFTAMGFSWSIKHPLSVYLWHSVCLHFCSLPFAVFSHTICVFQQVRKGAIGAKCGLVFAYSEGDTFDAENKFKCFNNKDAWTKRTSMSFFQDR